MSRWVRISASIFDTDAFDATPFSEREAWIWMIVNAAWKETTHRVGNKVVAVPVGAFFTTVRSLKEEWGWGSITRVQAYLKVLCEQEMIDIDTTQGKSQITVLNYKKYQEVSGETHAIAGQGKVKKRTKEGQEKVSKDTNTPDIF